MVYISDFQHWCPLCQLFSNFNQILASKINTFLRYVPVWKLKKKNLSVKMFIGADGERANHMAISLNIPGFNIFWSEFTTILLI